MSNSKGTKKPAERITRDLAKISLISERLSTKPWTEYDDGVQEVCAQIVARSLAHLQVALRAISKIKDAPPEEHEATPGPGVPWFDNAMDEMRD
jgi:hypothetical protein